MGGPDIGAALLGFSLLAGQEGHKSPPPSVVPMTPVPTLRRHRLSCRLCLYLVSLTGTERTEASEPHPPVLPDSQGDLLMLDPSPPYGRQAARHPPSDSTTESEEGTTPTPADPFSSPPSSQLRLRRKIGEGGGGEWSSQAFPLRTVAGQIQYWPFSASDLYNWKTYNLSFSQDPQALTGLIESILLTHQPTWDDCQQLLQTLLTTEERQRVYLEARKNVPGNDGRPTQLPNEIDEAFPLTRPDWDFNTVAGRERLRLYRQILLTGLRGAGRRPTNLAKG